MKTHHLISALFLTLAACASTEKRIAPANPTPRDIASGSNTIVLVKNEMTQTWIGDCATQEKKTCANSLSYHAFDEAGQLRLIYTELRVRESNGKSMPVVRTAYVVENNASTANYGNQYPADGGKLGQALSRMGNGPACPVTITVANNQKVMSSHTECFEEGP